MGGVLHLKTLEVLIVALAGCFIGIAIMYTIVTFRLEGWWRLVNAGLLASAQVLIILTVLRTGRARSRSCSQGSPSDGEA